MKLLIINPNISESVTALIESEARRAASPDTQITMATAASGVAYIETRFESLWGAYATALIAAEQHAAHDAVGARRRRHLNAVGVGLEHLDDGGQIDRGDVGAHRHRLHGVAGGRAAQGARDGADQCRKNRGAKKAQTTTSGSALDPLPSWLGSPRQELSP